MCMWPHRNSITNGQRMRDKTNGKVSRKEMKKYK